MLTPGASWRALGFLPPGLGALLPAPSQKDDRPHGQDEVSGPGRKAEVGVPDRAYPVFQKHLSVFKALVWGLGGQWVLALNTVTIGSCGKNKKGR